MSACRVARLDEGELGVAQCVRRMLAVQEARRQGGAQPVSHPRVDFDHACDNRGGPA
jgi:hypothetical protein